MNSSKGIIDKIINDAEEIAQGNMQEANIKAESIISKADQLAAKQLEEFKATLEQSSAEIVSRRATVAKLDAKRIVMQAKKTAMDDIFASAKAAIIGQDDSKYSNMIAGMIRNNAQDGDKVVVSKADSKRINKKFIANLASQLKINLELSDKFGDFDGGIILEGKNYDKNLTLDVELGIIREEYEIELAAKVFEE